MPVPRVRAAASGRRDALRVDTERLRQQHPILDVVRQYGVELRRSGSSFTGRCPFHSDQGRPNFVVFPRSERWWCFRCAAGGDAISFVQEFDHVSFREAAARLGADPPRSLARRRKPERPHPGVRPPAPLLDADQQAVLDAAVELYANRLLVDDAALAYMVGRGFPRELLERERVGYAAGDALVRYLAWRRLPLDAARKIGLLRADGREYLAGRIVFPEIRAGRAIWLIGRVLDTPGREMTSAGPRYLGLPGQKPLLGWEAASRDLRGVYLVEGPTDLLALRRLGVPALALCGTYLPGPTLEQLGRWARLYLLLDDDRAGREATARLVRTFGDRVIPVKLPAGVKDPGDLATRHDGADLLARAIQLGSVPPAPHGG